MRSGGKIAQTLAEHEKVSDMVHAVKLVAGELEVLGLADAQIGLHSCVLENFVNQFVGIRFDFN